jgi:hypothetical protein
MLSFSTVWLICSFAGSGVSAALWGWRGAVAIYVIALAIGLPYWMEWASHRPGFIPGSLGIDTAERLSMGLTLQWAICGIPSAFVGVKLRSIWGR